MPNKDDRERSKEYIKINGFSHPFPILQILAISLMLVIFLLGISIIPSIIEIEAPILDLIMGFDNYFILAIITDSLLLMLSDPADPRLIDQDYYRKGEKLQFCQDCSAQVDVLSYHCKVCCRCVEEFDHHCVFLNNCIGRKNYKQFFRLLLSLITYTSTNIGMGIWLFFNLENVFRWIALSYSILSFVVFAEILSLTIFHCYISCFLYKTTLQVIKGDKINIRQTINGEQKIFSPRILPSNLTNAPSKLEFHQTMFANGPQTQTPLYRQD